MHSIYQLAVKSYYDQIVYTASLYTGITVMNLQFSSQQKQDLLILQVMLYIISLL